eukprot:TRINITY_DN68161_c3_g7_i1.p1 TRINITY_DN68161_c3_g7~~TRINITY_DN68161_c3_g7_i1.p1  ORF type:complete len:383 (-),score=30.60 TRINITY_DN68161_c3_g7_i1:72-1157(-)
MASKAVVPLLSSSIGESITCSFSTMINCLETLTETVKQQSAQFRQLTDTLGTLEGQPLPSTSATEVHREDNPGSSSDVVTAGDSGTHTVHLNVGGTVFVTTKETLTNHDEKDSFFSAMVNGDWKPDFNDGKEFFIDRSPHAFSLILDYMRSDTPQNVVGGWTPNEASLVASEAAFFQLDGLKEKLATDLQPNQALGLTTRETGLINNQPLLCWEDNTHTQVTPGDKLQRGSFTHNNTWVRTGLYDVQLWGKLTTKKVVTKFHIFFVPECGDHITIRFGSPCTFCVCDLTFSQKEYSYQDPTYLRLSCNYDSSCGEFSVKRSDNNSVIRGNYKFLQFDSAPLPCVELNNRSSHPFPIGIMAA